MNDAVKTQRDGHILEVTLDRPKANAIDLNTSRSWARSLWNFATIRICGLRY